MKKVLVLTSSRADFGIYFPLLTKMKASKKIDLSILAFGTHLSKFHGYTLDQIRESGLEVDYTISSLVLGDTAGDIANSYALTAQKFADFWSLHSNDFDLVFVLGDRFEMAAAVSAGIPFNINFAHIHGGETTLGAIDNIYRHSISLASKWHFVSLTDFNSRLESILDNKDNIYTVGALSLDNIKEIPLLGLDEFHTKWQINLAKPTILITVHPETVASAINKFYAEELYKSLSVLANDYQLVITMPNADTLGSLYRAQYDKLKKDFTSRVFLIENFGTSSYLTAMKYASLMLGNTSSGIIEAASFQKFVINIGDRQKGRKAGDNVYHVIFNSEAIIQAVKDIENKTYQGENIYHKGDAADQIIQVIEKL
ncbi:UDP-N-acetylglucosamine 2-epimerase [Marivirga harenae]|uniref:UDP-N-acetylglucosamine 2-epimerase n=1 Tax=Marivirga harenae TaxID=2010992 RepID=UPI0026DFD3C2|nr:UDP-N-acetylglucosamine 2-epimerase [Marivirga harenae]WKV11362.1 UDP-N-acetylglucosamine 2-epimerase [Marivirga harenae]